MGLERGRRKGVLIEEENGRTSPYSKGILAQRLMVSGISRDKAYEIARKIEEKLTSKGIERIKQEKLQEIIYETIKEEVGEEEADRYKLWIKIKRKKEPIIILLGGATGCGKSTIASELAYRLGIRHVVGTDAIREVMRRILSKELMPFLHESSYTAWRAIHVPIPPTYDEMIVGFEEHAKHVVVGIEAVLRRALVEGMNMIIEGVHIVPGFIKKEFTDLPNVIPIILYVEDSDEHKIRFYARAQEAPFRKPVEEYIKDFEAIRRIQNYLVRQAEIYGVPAIKNESMEETVERIIGIITERLKRLV